VAATAVKAAAPAVLGTDGSFDLGPDRGLRLGAGAAGENAVAALPSDLSGQADAVRARAEESYRRTARALGTPRPPVSADEWRLAVDNATGGVFDVGSGRRLDEAGRGGITPRSLISSVLASLVGRP
jgi:hypothetical protein